MKINIGYLIPYWESQPQYASETGKYRWYAGP